MSELSNEKLTQIKRAAEKHGIASTNHSLMLLLTHKT